MMHHLTEAEIDQVSDDQISAPPPGSADLDLDAILDAILDAAQAAREEFRQSILDLFTDFLPDNEGQAGDFELLGPNETVAGRSIAEWTQEWWTWILQSPDAQNPGRDPTGAFAGNQPENPVFFVAGTGPSATSGSNETAERSFDVPEIPLLIPMINFFTTLESPEAETAQVNDWIASVTSLFASIDGVVVEHPEQYLVVTDFFSAGVVRPDTVIDKFAESFGLSIEGETLEPTKAAGYWLVVDDLEPGMHTIVFGGGTSEGFSTETTIHVNVVEDYIWGA